MKYFISDRRHLICKSKVKYSNLVSAERAKAALSIGYHKPHFIYKCGESKHYHLTTQVPTNQSNKDKSL